MPASLLANLPQATSQSQYWMGCEFPSRRSPEATPRSEPTLRGPPAIRLQKRKWPQFRSGSSVLREALPPFRCHRDAVPKTSGNIGSQDSVFKPLEYGYNRLQAFSIVEKRDRRRVSERAHGRSHPSHRIALVPDYFDRPIEDHGFVACARSPFWERRLFLGGSAFRDGHFGFPFPGFGMSRFGHQLPSS